MLRVVVCVCGLLCAMTVRASDDDLLDMGLEELMNLKVKSASLFEESRMKAAATIDKVDASEWELWGARNNEDAFRGLSSVQAYPTLFGGFALAVRGYAQSLSTRGIANLIDGIPVNEFIFGSAQYEREHTTLGVIDSIEFIKGPGSTLYGSDAFHSTVQFNTFYSDTEKASIGAQTGTYNYRQVNTKISRELTDDMLVNVALDYRQQGVWEWPYTNLHTNLPDSRDNRFDTSTVNVKLHNLISDDWYYRVQWHHNAFDGEGFVGGGGTNISQQQDISSGENHFDLLDGLLEHKLNSDLKIGVRTMRWRVERADFFEARLGPRQYDQQISKEQLQAYASYEKDSGSRLFVGLEASQQDIDQAELSRFNPDGSLIAKTTQAESGAARRINSIFAQGRWITPLEFVEVEAGLRSDDYSEFGRQNSPRLGFILPYNNNHVAKLIYGNAFRAPVSSELYGTATSRGNLNIKPEVMDSYEAIWMVTSEKTAYQITGFYNRWKNGIVSTPIVDPVYTSAYQNIASNTSHGIEAAYKIDISNTLIQTDVAHVYSHSEYNDRNYNAFPNWSFHINVSKNINEKQNIHVRWGDDFDWRSNSSATATKLPARYATDVAYEYKLNNQIRFLANLKNAFDRQNYTPSVWGNPDGERTPGREFEIQMHISFN